MREQSSRQTRRNHALGELRAAFARDNELYEQVLREFETDDTRDAAWSWLVTTWPVAGAGSAPGHLDWDERVGRIVLQGSKPDELDIDLGGHARLVLRWIKPGKFWMGSPLDELGRLTNETLHGVNITKGFWLGKYEVTQQQWNQVAGRNPSYFKAAPPDAPVEQVSWNEAQAFIQKLQAVFETRNPSLATLGFRLPTEAEWEYACRAGTVSRVYGGPITLLGNNNSPELDVMAWYGGNSGVDYAGGWDSSKWAGTQYPHLTAGTHVAGQKKPNAWGLYDMIGNVWELCADRFGEYPAGVQVDPRGPGQGAARVARGASWGNYALACRAAIRNEVPPTARHNRIGFRLAASL